MIDDKTETVSYWVILIKFYLCLSRWLILNMLCEAISILLYCVTSCNLLPFLLFVLGFVVLPSAAADVIVFSDNNGCPYREHMEEDLWLEIHFTTFHYLHFLLKFSSLMVGSWYSFLPWFAKSWHTRFLMKPFLNSGFFILMDI